MTFTLTRGNIPFLMTTYSKDLAILYSALIAIGIFGIFYIIKLAWETWREGK